jgi:5-methylcytosine-specific restriction protein A
LENRTDIIEGATKKVSVNAFERSSAARKKCIEYHGTSCAVCGMSFRNTYGDIGDGFIQVHHLKPLSSVDGQYEVDPIKDMIPVCPNCHAMIHKREKPYSIDEIKSFLRL